MTFSNLQLSLALLMTSTTLAAYRAGGRLQQRLAAYRAGGRLGNRLPACISAGHRGTGRLQLLLNCHRGAGRLELLIDRQSDLLGCWDACNGTGYRGSEHGLSEFITTRTNGYPVLSALVSAMLSPTLLLSAVC